MVNNDARRLLFAAQIVVFCGSMFATSACLATDSDKKSAKEVFSDSRVAQLALAAEKGEVEKIDALVKDGVSVNSRGHSNMTPLLFCFLAKNKKGYSALLRHKADPNLLTSEGGSVMHETASEADSFWLREALKQGGNPNLILVGNRFVKGDTPLFNAALAMRTENVKLLIAAKADLNHKNGTRGFPLLLAAGRQAYDIVFLLLEAGTDFRQKDHNGYDLVQHFSNRNGKTVQKEEQKEWFFKSVKFLKAKGEKFELRKD